jgi:hypothetical protein
MHVILSYTPQRCHHPSANLRILLLDIVLSTSLLSLANIMLLLSLQLCVSITSNTRNGALDGTSSTVCNTRAEVVELTLGFLAFAFGVLLGTCALKILLSNMLAPVHIRVFCNDLTGNAKREQGSNIPQNRQDYPESPSQIQWSGSRNP